jgi:hypothetical protein
MPFTPTEFTVRDREDIEKALELIQDMNGSVKRHDEEIFGDDRKKTPGLVKDVAEIKDTILTARTVIRTLWAVAIFLGVTNIAAIIVLLNGGS